MLKAIDKSGQSVMADASSRLCDYFCPECQEKLIVKHGRFVTWHFAHRKESTCSFSEGETERHEAMKLACLRMFPTAQMEVQFPHVQRRADIVIGRVVIECQHSPLSVPEMEQRTRDYNIAGYGVLWIFHVSRLGNRRAARFADYSRIGEYMPCIEAIECPCHIAMDDLGECAAFWLEKAKIRFRFSDGDYPDSIYYPKRLKRITFFKTGIVIGADKSGDPCQ